MTPFANRREMRERAGITDVLVVGAGPAGSAAAHQCARRGLATLLIDKQRFPRGKVCGCCLSGAACAVLEEMGLGAVLDGAVAQERVVLHAGNATAEFPVVRGLGGGGRILSRRVLDQALIDAATREGAEFCDETRALGVENHEDCAEVSVQSRGETRSLRARVVVVADGLAGRLVDGLLGRRIERRRGAIGVGAVLGPGTSEIRAGVVELALGAGGYFGLARLETGEVDLAAALDPRHVRMQGGVGEALGSIASRCDVKLNGLEDVAWKGTPTLASRRRAVAARRVFVVGDAASYLEPITGEGMGWALASGVSVARLVERGAVSWRDSLAGEWQGMHKEIVPRWRGLCGSASLLLRSPAVARLAIRTLGCRPDVASSLVGMTSRRFDVVQT